MGVSMEKGIEAMRVLSIKGQAGRSNDRPANFSAVALPSARHPYPPPGNGIICHAEKCELFTDRLLM